MNKRANRVYWMLFIMMLILGLSMAIDGIRADKHSEDNITEIEQSDEDNTGNTDTRQASESESDETTEEETTTEGTTLDPAVGDKVYEEFYGGQAFIGDSIVKGFSTYTSKAEAPAWLNNLVFLSKTSWGISSALDANGPLYRGKEQSVITSLAEIKPSRVFINLGINEMNGLGSPGYSTDKLMNKYDEFIQQVKTTLPSARIFVISVTPCTAEKETAIFNNTGIRNFNAALKEKCRDWNAVYVDLAGYFGDVLDPELSSDNFVHHNDTAYREKWLPCLEKLAVENTPLQRIEAIELSVENAETTSSYDDYYEPEITS